MELLIFARAPAIVVPDLAIFVVPGLEVSEKR